MAVAGSGESTPLSGNSASAAVPVRNNVRHANNTVRDGVTIFRPKSLRRARCLKQVLTAEKWDAYAHGRVGTSRWPSIGKGAGQPYFRAPPSGPLAPLDTLNYGPSSMFFILKATPKRSKFVVHSACLTQLRSVH